MLDRQLYIILPSSKLCRNGFHNGVRFIDTTTDAPDARHLLAVYVMHDPCIGRIHFPDGGNKRVPHAILCGGIHCRCQKSSPKIDKFFPIFISGTLEYWERNA